MDVIRGVVDAKPNAVVVATMSHGVLKQVDKQLLQHGGVTHDHRAFPDRARVDKALSLVFSHHLIGLCQIVHQGAQIELGEGRTVRAALDAGETQEGVENSVHPFELGLGVLNFSARIPPCLELCQGAPEPEISAREW